MAKVTVDGIELDITFHVCREGDILYSVVLGNDIFEQIDMVINSDRAEFRYRDNLSKMQEMSINENVSSIGELQNEFGHIVHSVSLEDESNDQLDVQHLKKDIRMKLENLIRTYKPTKPILTNF